MSKRGAEGILAAAGKSPSSSKPLDLTPKAEPEGVAALPEPKDDSTESKPEAKKSATPSKSTQKRSPAGEAVGKSIGSSIGSGFSMGNEAAGFVLGLMLWGWVVRPYLNGGLNGVKTVLMAKFFNKKLDGTELP